MIPRSELCSTSLRLFVIRCLTDLDGVYKDDAVFHEPVCLTASDIVLLAQERGSGIGYSSESLASMVGIYIREFCHYGYAVHLDNGKYCLIRGEKACM